MTVAEQWEKDVEQYESEFNYLTAKEFLNKVIELKDSRSEKEVAEALGMTLVEISKRIKAAQNKIRKVLEARVGELKEAGLSIKEIAIKLGKEESTIRRLLEIE